MSAPGTLILLYHRVAEVASDPCRLCVNPRRFAEHLEVLAGNYDVIPLRDVSAGANARRARPSVVVTFDDGYADNLTDAKPALERFGIPATVHVTSGYLGTGREFWWDELERMLLQPGTLPPTLRLCANDGIREWHLGEAASYTPEEYAKHVGWSLLQNDDPGPRQQAYRAIVRMFFPLPLREREALLEELRLQACGTARSTYRVLTPEEIPLLANSGLIEVGAHTETHPVLSAHSLAVQRQEIQKSKQRLEEILGGPVDSFAYPFGTKAHYGRDTVAAVQEAGFARACSNFSGLVRPDVDLFQLPRFMVFDWDGDEFARQISQWWK